MASIGTFNRLRLLKEKAFGVYLDGGELGEILLPARYRPEGSRVGDEIDAFIYLDSEDCLIATTEQPRATVGQVALMRAVSVGPVGTFVDWGLPKDLLVPFGEQKRRMEEGRNYLVYVYLDNSHRIAGSTKLDRHLDHSPPHYRNHQAVELVIAERTELGVKAIVDHRHWGVIHTGDLFRPLRYGERLTGYIKRVRDDGKLDLFLQQPGYGEIDALAQAVLARLQQEGGFLAVSDRSPPALISRLFGTSKKRFKLAIGALYKQRLIRIEETGIRLNDPRHS